MPMYDYKCRDCGHTFSEVMGIKERETKAVKCPKCGSAAVTPVYSGFVPVTSKKS